MDDAWRTIDDRLHAWYDAPSHAAGATLVEAVVAASGRLVDVDVRDRGVRVRLDRDDVGLAPAIDVAAREAGLVAAPQRLQSLRLVVETTDPARIAPFWALALGYDEHVRADGVLLADPWRRDLPVLLVRDREARPQRDRIHVDVVRPTSAVAAFGDATGPASGPFGVRRSDPDGNEIDAVPGDPLEGASDWWTLFAAVARYATPSPQAAAALVAAAARLADDAGERLGIDVRAGSVTVDGGKDAWEHDGTARPTFVALAAAIQRAAHEAGATSQPGDLRFVQLGLDAVDVASARAVWRAILSSEHDPREHLTDLVDPLGLGHVLFLQDMDATEHERRAQRPRIRVDVLVPADAVDARLDAVVAAGGRVLEQRDGRAIVADPEGAIATIVAG